jgi:hypothetical protein
VIAFHIYANNDGDHPAPETAVKMTEYVKSKLRRHSDVTGKPLWVTEGGWGRSDDTNWSNSDQPAAFLMRYETLLAFEGIERLYWYSYDAGWGTLSSDSGTESPQAGAYRTIHDWLLGKTVTDCSAKSHLWSCRLEGPNFKGSLVWNDEYEKTASFDPKGFTRFREAGREPLPVDQKAGRISIGNIAVLFESTAASGR